MKKRILAMVMALAMLTVLFAGCGGNAGSTDNKTLVIGGIGPLNGSAAQYGVAVKNGAQIAIDEINAAGGVNGMTLKLASKTTKPIPLRQPTPTI